MSSTANQQQAAPPSAISEALSLDLQVLTLLLRRNSAAHHRARYYRRLQMMIRSLERYGLHDANASFYEELVSPIRAELEWIQSMADRDRRKRARGVEDKWTTTASSTRRRESSQRDDDGVAYRNTDNDDETSLLVSQTIGLSRKLTHHLPEVLSRILYAAEGLYTELSRGYFVPFCTVALAAISRIRALLMRMGREGCVDLGRILTAIDSVLEADGTNAIEGDLWHDKFDLLRLKRLLKKIRQNNELGKDTDWGDWTSKLMDTFVEIDPQEHEKEQQERRRQGALRRGISDMSTSSASKMLDKNTISAKTDDFDDDNDDNENNEESVISAPKEAPGEGANDLGESVDIGQNDDLLSAGGESTTKQQKKRKGTVSAANTLDVNEQILQMMKEKARPKSGIGGGGDYGGDGNPKKKKRKKEKLQQPTTAASSSIDDIFGGLGDNEKGSGISEEARQDKKKSKKVKQTKKDKKKKSKRNAVDDIFDGL